MTSTSAAIAIEQLAFGYQPQQTIVRIPHWQVNCGERVFVYGPSGSGKSTLLNILSGFLHPASGEVNILGTRTDKLRGRKLDKFRAEHIGTVCQQFNLIPYLSVLDNLLVAAHFGRGGKQQARHDAQLLLPALALPVSLLAQTASQLSVGQQQRVAIARALINRPQLLIVDEPTSALDYHASQAFMSLLHETVCTRKTTLIFVSHDERLAPDFDRQVNFNDLNCVETSDAD
ncbi:MAG TPA: ABC transporter ATP-binding protein [Cellvibrionaceae bacterium]